MFRSREESDNISVSSGKSIKQKLSKFKSVFKGKRKKSRKNSNPSPGGGGGVNSPLPADTSQYEIELDGNTIGTAPGTPDRQDPPPAPGGLVPLTAEEIQALEEEASQGSHEQQNQGPPSIGDDAIEEEEESSALMVVLLLLDPGTRRFELVQLEFDSNKARVSDLLSQIPMSVTEEAFRKIDYRGVCDRTAKEHKGRSRLADFCKSKDILVAVPKKFSPKEAARLGRSILGDEKVVQMLRISGLDTAPWIQNVKTVEDDVVTDMRSRDTSFEANPAIKPKDKFAMQEKNKTLPFIAICALLLILTQVVYRYTTNMPPPPKPTLPELEQPVSAKCKVLFFLPSCRQAKRAAAAAELDVMDNKPCEGPNCLSLKSNKISTPQATA